MEKEFYKPGAYTPERYDDLIPNRHVTRNWRRFRAATVVCGLFTAFAMVMGAVCFWPNDPYIQVRWACELIPRLFWSFAPATAFLVFIDGKINGNIFKGVVSNPLGCAIFASVIFYSVITLVASAMH
jgi:hypothetical protein